MVKQILMNGYLVLGLSIADYGFYINFDKGIS